MNARNYLFKKKARYLPAIYRSCLKLNWEITSNPIASLALENSAFFKWLLRRRQRQGFRSFENQGVCFCK